MNTRETSIARSIANFIALQITQGIYAEGQKLPSIREYAKSHGHSNNTVINAYDDLTAKGLIEPRRGSGYFVAGMPRATMSDVEPTSLDCAMDIVWLMREQLRDAPGDLHVGDGFMPVAWTAEVEFDKCSKKLSHATRLGTMCRYGTRFGYAPLRHYLARRLAGMAIEATPNQIVLTHGANAAMEIVIANFVKPGDTVLVDEPGYYPLFGKLKLRGARIVGVPRQWDGPNVQALEQILQTTRPRLFFTQTLGHNPTGSDTSPAKAHRILHLAEQHDLLIVEDDPFADLKSDSMLRISTLDQLNRTIYIGSFSKTVSPALRVGFIACHPDLASDLADVKMLLHVSSSEYCERTLEAIVTEGSFKRNISRLRDRLEEATDSAARIFSSRGYPVFHQARHSLYLWATIPGAPDSMQLARNLMKQNIVLAPGAIFLVDPQQVTSWARYNVTYASDPRFLASLPG
ncbi:PLP-dependent aminotransferase family protein [Janthinobacterium sp. 17J80-10]|uniref:aminotransferase-like domain-containing protein n=1 Tax=Janthinobacterium sp. 17J80-10 TaxID=2497863 RepID=UPI0010059CAC|nr:PLP-dependent aminotransferase family protein [Janthinobacterium sp. 17J80-10]QAU33122.1 PLP-dependent aminotransferase family protein [Janthinobacterium sp. 17J80-10]